MSSTTQILFNSPALHSLKRDQLVKLCKIHSIKATGKNTELVDKLRQHALTLPRDAPLSIAARSEFAPRVDGSFESGNPFFERTRPSEQWEVVMDSIEEMEEASSAQGSLNSLKTIGRDNAGEFGTGVSKSSVGSSLKAFATSLGLKRTDALNSTLSKPATSLKSHLSTSTLAPEVTATVPPAGSVPQSDPFTYNTYGNEPIADADIEVPVPGQALRPGVPAPLNARLSLGLGLTERQTPSKESQPTTTIRLISNQRSGDGPQGPSCPIPSTPELAPFKTTFDLIMSPRMASGIGFGTFKSAIAWSSEKIYPAIPSETTDPSARAKLPDLVDMDGDVTMPGALSSPCSSTSFVINVAGDVTMASPPDGSTLKPPSEPFIFGSPLPRHRVSDAQFREAAANVLDEMNKRLQAEGVNPVNLDIMKRLHPGATGSLQTTEGLSISKGERQTREITGTFERKHQAEFSKMEGIDALVKRKTASVNKTDGYARVSVGKKRKSSVLIDEPRRVPTQVAGRASGTRVISNGRRGKMMPGAFDSEDLDREADADEERGKKRAKMDGNGADVHDTNLEDQKKKEKEREAVRRKLEMNKARRSSAAAAARQSGRVSIGRVQQKQKPSRFGFLAHAKSIVQSVFGRSKPAAAGLSTVTAPTASSRAKTGKPQELDQIPKKALKNSMTLPTPEAKLTVGSRGSAGGRGNINHEREQLIAARSRSPIPGFSDQNLMGVRLKKSSAPAAITISRDDSAPFLDTNNMGRKVSSMGARGLLANGSAVGSLGVKMAERGQVPSSSRLYAPTASSLAKMNGRMATSELSSDGKQVSGTPADRKQNTLGSITNNVVHDTVATSGALTIGNVPLKTSFSSSGTTTENVLTVDTHLVSTKPLLQRQRTLSSRKPRISRSKVISRLASQRANAVKNDGMPNAGIRRASATGKIRISAGRTRDTRSNKPVGRFSHSGLNSGGNDLLMSAKKRVRQSEYYARRRSRVEVKPGKT